mgnify:CR=1 FL=1
MKRGESFGPRGASDAGDYDPGVGASAIGGGDHHPLIAFKGCETADSTAFGTAYLIKPDAGQCEVK